MNITIIGCDGAYPRVNGATSAYLVQDNETKVLLDCGSGSISRLQNHIELKELDGIVISHYHADHYADLECMQFATMLDTFEKKRENPLVIYGPGEEQMLTYKNFCQGNTFKDKESFTIGSLTFETKLNKHGIEAYSIKVTNEDGECLVYTGDTGYYDELPVFCEEASLLIAESSCYEYERGKLSGHMTGGEAGIVAEKSGVNTLILTHLPHYGDVEKMVDEAKQFFNGEVILARYNSCIEV